MGETIHYCLFIRSVLLWTNGRISATCPLLPMLIMENRHLPTRWLVKLVSLLVTELGTLVLLIREKTNKNVASPSSQRESIYLSTCIYVYMFGIYIISYTFMSVCLSIYLSIYLSTYLSIYIYLSIYLFIHLYCICTCTYLSVYLSIYLSIYLPFL